MLPLVGVPVGESESTGMLVLGGSESTGILVLGELVPRLVVLGLLVTVGMLVLVGLYVCVGKSVDEVGEAVVPSNGVGKDVAGRWDNETGAPVVIVGGVGKAVIANGAGKSVIANGAGASVPPIAVGDAVPTIDGTSLGVMAPPAGDNDGVAAVGGALKQSKHKGVTPSGNFRGSAVLGQAVNVNIPSTTASFDNILSPQRHKFC